MTDKRNGKHVNFRPVTHEVLMARAKFLAESRGVKPSLPQYLMEASEFFERKRDA